MANFRDPSMPFLTLAALFSLEQPVSIGGDWQFGMGASGCTSEGRDEALPLCIPRSAKQHRRATLPPPSIGALCRGVGKIACCNWKMLFQLRHTATSCPSSLNTIPSRQILHNASGTANTLSSTPPLSSNFNASSYYSSSYSPSPAPIVPPSASSLP